MIPRAAAASHRVITDSLFSKQELIELLDFPAERVDVVYPFVSPELLDLAKAIERPTEGRGDYALMLSSLNPRKNARRTIEGFTRAAVPDLRLVLVGDVGGIYSDLPLQGVVNERIELRGSVDDAELVRLYKGARLFLYPSLYEGFGIPPLEAMTCGCPVLAARAASLPEVCGDAALYVDPLSVEDIADGIRRLAGDEDLRRTLVKRGREIASHFRVAAAADRLLAIVRDEVGGL